MKDKINVVFMGTPDFAVTTLKKLVESKKYNVVSCVTNPDKPSGRGMKLKTSPVKDFAISNGIPVFQPQKVKNNLDIYNTLKKMDADFFVVVAYGKILPKDILDIPRYGAINVHASLLPKYRGAAPMQWALINGENKTGVTTMYMDVGMDTGDMLLKEEIDIKKDDNLESIHDKLKEIGANLLIETLDGIISNTITRKKQGDNFSMAPMIHKDMTKIDFNNTPQSICNFVRGLSPVPGAFATLENGKIYKIFKTEEVVYEDVKDEEENGKIVYVSKDKLYIKCNGGCISVLQIQPPNSKKMDIKSFLAGNKLDINQKFI